MLLGGIMSKNVVFMISIVSDSRSAEQGYDFSVKSWRNWCNKNDVELVVMEQPIYPIDQMKLTWQRYFVIDILEENDVDYNQVCMVDADTIIHPDTPNFFELTEGKYCGVVNPVNEWVMKSIELYSHLMFDNRMIKYYDYINGGFQIFNKKHHPFLKMMTQFYLSNQEKILNIQNTYGAGSDQTPLNFFLQEHNMDVKLLSAKFNMQDMVRYEALNEDLIHTKVGWIYHFNTWPKPNPAYWMEKTYRSLYEN